MICANSHYSKNKNKMFSYIWPNEDKITMSLPVNDSHQRSRERKTTKLKLVSIQRAEIKRDDEGDERVCSLKSNLLSNIKIIRCLHTPRDSFVQISAFFNLLNKWHVRSEFKLKGMPSFHVHMYLHAWCKTRANTHNAHSIVHALWGCMHVLVCQKRESNAQAAMVACTIGILPLSICV